MPIISFREDYIPTWVSASMFEKLWPKDDHYISEWPFNPHSEWFVLDDLKIATAFRTSEIHVLPHSNEPTISFTNGRHRARWLLQLGEDEIPVGIHKDDLEFAYSIRLAIRPVVIDDHMPEPKSFWWRRA